MADPQYYVMHQTWVARVTDDGNRAEYREPTGRWVPTGEQWWIREHGHPVDGEEEALRQVRPPFEILPGVGIGPFRLGMTERELEDLCCEYGLRNEGAFTSGLSIVCENGLAVQITFAAHMGLSLAGEPLMHWSDLDNQNVRRLLGTLAPPGPDWTEMDGLVVHHWERRDEPVFAFLVYAPGYRSSAAVTPAPPGPAAVQELVRVLQEARGLLSRPENVFGWSSWEGFEDAVNEIDGIVRALEKSERVEPLDVAVLFAPTGPIQEVSLSSGWGKEFLRVADQFDAAARRMGWDVS